MKLLLAVDANNYGIAGAIQALASLQLEQCKADETGEVRSPDGSVHGSWRIADDLESFTGADIPKVAVLVDRGIVQEIRSTARLQAVVLDSDKDGADEDEIARTPEDDPWSETCYTFHGEVEPDPSVIATWNALSAHAANR